MKKLGLILALLLLVSPASADHWVYIELTDKYGVTLDDDKGRSKRGDIVDIVPADGTNIPSDVVKTDFAIVKVSGLTDELISKWQEGWEDKAYRKYRLKNVWTNNLSLGIYPNIINVSILNGNVRIKNNGDLAAYKSGQRTYAYLKRPAIIAYNYVKYAFDYWVMPAYAFSTTTCGDDVTEDREQICTVNKTGEDYASISVWEAAKDGDLVTDKQQRTCELYNDDGQLDDDTDINGSTTDASYFMKVTSPVGERHDGTAGVGAFLTSTNQYGPTFYVNDVFVVIEWLEMTRVHATPGATQSNAVIFIQGGGENFTIQNNIIHDADSANEWMFAIQVRDNFGASTDNYVINNIIYDNDASGFNGGTYEVLTFNFYNNTFYNNADYGIDCAGADADDNCVAINNISMANGAGDYNALDTDTNNLSTGATVTFESTTGGSENFHLTAGATDAIDAGTDLSGTFAIDIDNVVRTGTWDIGADEFVGVAGRTRRFF